MEDVDRRRLRLRMPVRISSYPDPIVPYPETAVFRQNSPPQSGKLAIRTFNLAREID